MPKISGIAHVELSVSDLDTSSRWYCDLLGAREVFRAPDAAEGIVACAILVPGFGTLMAFTQHNGHDGAPFTPRRSGLDHVSFAVADREQLDAWRTHLDSLQVKHSGLRDYGYADAITFSDPDGIALELFCPKVALPAS